MSLKIKVGELKKILADQADDAEVVIKRGTVTIQQTTTRLVIGKEVKPKTEAAAAVQ